MILKEVKKEIKELLKANNKEKLIKKLREYLKKEFKGIDYTTCVDDKLKNEEFYKLWKIKGSDYYYAVSNYGRMAIEDIEGKNRKIIPQYQDCECNWKLDEKKFKEQYNKNFKDITLAKYQKVYDYFIKETKWLKDEYNEINNIYGCVDKECNLELHHICQNGDNRIDNMIYLPACIHRAVHSNK